MTEYRYINIVIHRNNDVSAIRHDYAGIPELMVGNNIIVSNTNNLRISTKNISTPKSESLV